MTSFDSDLRSLIKIWVRLGETYPSLIEAMEHEINILRKTPRAYSDEISEGAELRIGPTT